MFGIADKNAFFIIRQHGQSPSWQPLCSALHVKRIETGVVFERTVVVVDAAGRSMQLRRITVELNKPTRDGDSELLLLTNLPRPQVGALKVATHRAVKALRGRVEGFSPASGSQFSLLPADKNAVAMVGTRQTTHYGIEVARNAAPTVKRVAQELGGKSANIILRDADLKTARYLQRRAQFGEAVISIDPVVNRPQAGSASAPNSTDSASGRLAMIAIGCRKLPNWLASTM